MFPSTPLLLCGSYLLSCTVHWIPYWGHTSIHIARAESDRAPCVHSSDMWCWVSSWADVHDRRKQQKRNWKACGHRPNKAVNHTRLWLNLYHTSRATHHLLHYFMTSKTNLQGYLCLHGRQMYSNQPELYDSLLNTNLNNQKTFLIHFLPFCYHLFFRLYLLCLTWILNWLIYYILYNISFD